jgi:hypothetical protein
MQIDRSWVIVIHFVWTVAISGYAFGIRSLWFDLIILANAAAAAAVAMFRGEKYGILKVTLWDEVLGFVTVMVLAHLFY